MPISPLDFGDTLLGRGRGGKGAPGQSPILLAPHRHAFQHPVSASRFKVPGIFIIALSAH
jgi:hypothetical protein